MADPSHYEPLRRRFGEAARFNDPLARYTVARLGGPADAVIEASRPDVLADAVLVCWQNAWPVRIIGSGANVLFSDQGFRGVIVINRTKKLHIDDQRGIVNAESGVGLITLARDTMTHGLSGFEWAIGVPGTVGGAVVNNAGAHDGDMAGCLLSTDVLIEPDRREEWGLPELAYRYRESALKRGPLRAVVLSAELHFSPGHEPGKLRTHADEFAANRRRTQPTGASLGSMFKNPPNDFAGRLIEASGLKGTRSGGVVISTTHGNFFVNTGGGMAADYRVLIDRARETVQAKFGIELELEVELIGETPEM
ncbi:MAG: UDP-N-acetylmuramate dehydrogenase [Aggregatilineales bacterium]